MLVLVPVLASCGGPDLTAGSSPTPYHQSSPSASASPAEQLGPGGLTLDEEIGAVIMVGFLGSPSDSVIADWNRHQFGGLLIVNNNHNATTASSMKAVIARVRGTVRHRLIAATDQEGGQVCLAINSVPCEPMPVGQAGTTRMAAALKALGFDLDLGPVSDVCSGSGSIMWGRCYGTSPSSVAAAVGAVVDAIHAAGMLSAAKHFPGHGDTSVSSETSLPRINESLATLESRDWPPFKAAVAHGVDLVLLGHLYYPALDTVHSADLSPGHDPEAAVGRGLSGRDHLGRYGDGGDNKFDAGDRGRCRVPCQRRRHGDDRPPHLGCGCDVQRDQGSRRERQAQALPPRPGGGRPPGIAQPLLTVAAGVSCPR